MLLPLVNTPMINYTLEWLVMNGIEVIYVLCCAYADQIERHLKQVGWFQRKNVKIETIISQDCQSVGDAMRMMDHKDLIKSDFVLVSGDVVTNMDLQKALEEHEKRREADKSAIMTMVLKSGMYSDHRLRLGDLGALTVIDSSTKRLLRFEENRDSDVFNYERQKKDINLDISVFDDRKNVSLRADLIDTGIYICSTEVLMLFSDNFDYQNVRKDFVTGVLSEEELGNKLYMHEVEERYATRIRSLRCFAAVTKDILSRWTFPFVPDANLFKQGSQFIDSYGLLQQEWGPPESQYTYSKGKIYMDACVSVARTSSIQHSVCIGRGTIIGPSTKIRDSVIGENCRIGKNVTLIGCIIGNDVTIHTGAHIKESFLCDGVVINEGVSIRPNCILSYNVVIEREILIPADSRISLAKPGQECQVISGSDDEDAFGTSPDGLSTSGLSDDVPEHAVTPAARSAAMALAHGGVPETDMDFDALVVGKMGAGYMWKPHAAANQIAASRRSLAYDIEALNIQETRWVSHTFAMEEEYLESSAQAQDSSSDDDRVDDPMEMMQDHHFKEEVAETFLRCIKESISQENVVIELNGLKIAEDKTFADCARFILTTCLGLCLPPPPGIAKEYESLYATDKPDISSDSGKLELLKRSLGSLKRWTSLLQKFLKNEDDQVEVLLTLEEFCGGEGEFENTGEHGSLFEKIFPQLLKVMYELEIVSEQALLVWAEEKEHATEHEKRFLELAAPFLEWLEEAEEESESEEEESDEE
jgi:translation initiation factor eIF-2B subunit epsilon